MQLRNNKDHFSYKSEYGTYVCIQRKLGIKTVYDVLIKSQYEYNILDITQIQPYSKCAACYRYHPNPIKAKPRMLVITMILYKCTEV